MPVNQISMTLFLYGSKKYYKKGVKWYINIVKEMLAK